jgi:hypothetical protein
MATRVAHARLLRAARSVITMCLAAIGVAVGASPLFATLTVTTKYTYNADGELTAITKTTDEGTETTYVTWDNFVPNVDDPGTGTVMVGNGTLVAFGPSPGLPAQFQFDARQRLIGYTDGNLVERVDYQANGTLRSTEVGGDARRFYCDDSQHAEITNIYQEGHHLWSGYLEHVRYLSDGTEQVLLQPRKDMAAEYDADGKALHSYHYDAYGAQADEPLQSTYDLHDNPMQYAAEYRDPIWGGYYLRCGGRTTATPTRTQFCTHWSFTDGDSIRFSPR